MDYLVGDFIIRLKNAAVAKRRTVVVPLTKMHKKLGAVLVQEKYLESINEGEKDGRKVLIATLQYENRVPVLSGVRIVSKPSLRVYIAAKNIDIRKRKLGTAILSTNGGIMTEKEAKKKGVGGELLFHVW